MEYKNFNDKTKLTINQTTHRLTNQITKIMTHGADNTVVLTKLELWLLVITCLAVLAGIKLI